MEDRPSDAAPEKCSLRAIKRPVFWLLGIGIISPMSCWIGIKDKDFVLSFQKDSVMADPDKAGEGDRAERKVFIRLHIVGPDRADD